MAFSNQLSAAQPTRSSLMTAGALLTFLFVLALTPRVFMAYRLSSLCPDGVFFIDKAERLEHGAIKQAADPYDLNVYPLVLSVLHRAGLSWETAAKCWGVFSASLVVLPLFGWVRRMFDQRVATLSCVLYAAHPKLIEWAPEAIRESTFWLLYMLSVYCLWRAVTEVRLGWFAAGGCSLFLAANTRFEGWFLLIPLVFWCGWRLWSLRRGRGRLAAGVMVLALCYPLTLAVLVGSHGYQCWAWGSFHRLRMVVTWVGSSVSALQTAESSGEETNRKAKPSSPVEPGPLTPAPAVAEVTSPPPPPSSGRIAWIVADKWLRAFSPVYGVLVLLGLARWWRLWLRRDQFPFLLLALVTFGAMWIHAFTAWASSTRYVLPVVIVATPPAAMGLLPLCRAAARLAAWLVPRQAVAPYAAATAALVMVFLASTADGICSRTSSHAARAKLGRWVRQRYGPQRVILGSPNWKTAGYYAQAEYHVLPYRQAQISTPRFRRDLVRCEPHLVLLCRHRLSCPHVKALVEQAEAFGMRSVASEQLPVLCRGNVIVMIQPPSETTACVPRAIQPTTLRPPHLSKWRSSRQGPRRLTPSTTAGFVPLAGADVPRPVSPVGLHAIRQVRAEMARSPRESGPKEAGQKPQASVRGK